MKKTLAIGLLWIGCGASEEAPVVDLSVVASSGGVAAAASDLGYTITVTTMRAAVRNFEFTIEGETHQDIRCPQGALCAGPDLAHPGHLAGGTVTGELRGDFLVDWTQDGEALGVATLIVGDYHGANFTFRRASEEDGLDAADPLLGHTAHLAGTATKDAHDYPFEAVIDIDEDTPMIGMPFEYVLVEEEQPTLAVEALIVDPVEGDTLFDAIDFAALTDGEGAVSIEPGQDAHNILKRQIQVHDHYQTVTR